MGPNRLSLPKGDGTMQVSRSLSVLVFAQASVMAGCASDNSSKTAPKAAAAAGQGGSSGTGGSATGGSATGGSSADGGTSGSGGASGSGGTKGGTGGTMGGSGGMASGGVAGLDPPPVKMVLPCDKLDDSPLGEWEQVALDP